MLDAPRRFYSLDALRGLAALSVVFWHWQHFFYRGTQYGAFPIEQQPLYFLFYPLYHRGWLAVDLFFSLSGFIFYWLYAVQIHARKISAKDFFVLRFSRLYPLHLATLLAVAAGQALLFNHLHAYFVYGQNDLSHFILNLLFVPAWGFQDGYSFNAPVWSVSVEVFLYLVFFVVCRFLPARVIVLLVLAVAGFFFVQPLVLPLGRGLFSFFIGGCMYLLYAQLLRRELVKIVALPLMLLTAGLWIAVAAGIHFKVDVNSFCRIVLFPSTILALALGETVRGTLGKRLAFLGDISYSSYMLHFPLQLAFTGVAVAFGLQQSMYFSTLMLLLFFAVLLALSWCSFHFFELPVQNRIRRRWLSGN